MCNYTAVKGIHLLGDRTLLFPCFEQDTHLLLEYKLYELKHNYSVGFFS